MNDKGHARFDAICKEVFEPVIKHNFDKYQKQADTDPNKNADVITIGLQAEYHKAANKIVDAISEYKKLINFAGDGVIDLLQKQIDHSVFDLANKLAKNDQYNITIFSAGNMRLFFNAKLRKMPDHVSLQNIADKMQRHALATLVDDDKVKISDAEHESNLQIDLTRRPHSEDLQLYFYMTDNKSELSRTNDPQTMMLENPADVEFLAKVIQLINDYFEGLNVISHYFEVKENVRN